VLRDRDLESTSWYLDAHGTQSSEDVDRIYWHLDAHLSKKHTSETYWQNEDLDVHHPMNTYLNQKTVREEVQYSLMKWEILACPSRSVSKDLYKMKISNKRSPWGMGEVSMVLGDNRGGNSSTRMDGESSFTARASC